MDATDTDTPVDQLVLRLTDEALTTVTGIRDAEEDPAALALRVEVTGVRGSDFTYDLAFAPAAGADRDAAGTAKGGRTGGTPAASILRLKAPTSAAPTGDVQAGWCSATPTTRIRWAWTGPSS